MIKKQDITGRIKSLKLSHVLTMVIFSIVFIGAIFGIIEYQKSRKDVIEPIIEVLYPIDGDVFDFETTVLEGNVENAKDVFINNEEVEVDSEGRFVKEINLSEGENVIIITAKTRDIEKDKTITVERTESIVYEEVTPVSVITTEPVSNLSSSGPETLWIPEISTLSLAGISWYGSKRKLRKSLNK